MLSRTREYEEAVAQILKHISAIHKVSRNLGRTVQDPPAGAVAGLPQPHTRVLEPAAGPTPADSLASVEPTLAPAPASSDAGEPAEAPAPTPADVADESAAASAEAAAAELARPKPNIFLLNNPGQPPRPRVGVRT